MPRRLGCGLGGHFPRPDIEGIQPDLAIGRGWYEVPAGMGVTVNEGMGGEEILGLPGRFESLHLTLSDAVAAQLVGHDQPRLILRPRQQPFEEVLCCLGTAPDPDQDVEHDAILIDGAPEIVLDALDADENFVHVPLVARAESDQSGS